MVYVNSSISAYIMQVEIKYIGGTGMDYYEIGQRIRKIRKAHGLSQENLAEHIGISPTHMSHIETGNTKLSLPVLVSLANALEVHTDDLLYEKHCIDRSDTIDSIMSVLSTCTTQQIRILEDVLTATKKSLDQNM